MWRRVDGLLHSASYSRRTRLNGRLGEGQMSSFPPAWINSLADRVPCPAFGKTIDAGLCWECAMADHGGPTDTAESLRRWIAETNRFSSVTDFQKVCAKCRYCPWQPA